MSDYTIMEYNVQTKKYTRIGMSDGVDSKIAKQNFIDKHSWSPRDNIILFAKPPLCR